MKVKVSTTKLNDITLHPIDESRRLGTVTAATPATVNINLPNAASHTLLHHGECLQRGIVGEYVCFPSDSGVILGRLTKVELPERDRLTVEPSLDKQPDPNPIGTISLLSDIILHPPKASGTVQSPPRVGCPAYTASPQFLEWVLNTSIGAKSDGVSLNLGSVAGASGAHVRVTPERLFGRHCAILGVTGGGKSFTLSRILEECTQHNAKVILIDATGEFSTFSTHTTHVCLSSENDDPPDCTSVSVPHNHLTEQDLFALFTPSPQSQAPILREAIRSLRLATVLGSDDEMVEGGVLVKAHRNKTDIDDAFLKHAQEVENPESTFDIHKLLEQIKEECVWPPRLNASNYGEINPNTLGYCTPLMLRIGAMLNDSAFAPILNPGLARALKSRVSSFLNGPDKSLLRVSMRHTSHRGHIRPVLANAIGRFLMDAARTGRFKCQPVLVVLDEAHQFLSKSLGSEEYLQRLDAFEIIAKEGRKYGLTIVLATQRPRDIPDGVLSQMGTLIVHRLAHPADRDVVDKSARDIDRSVMSFLPTLAPGTALILGADFPVPIPIQILKPTHEPKSAGPDYQSHWAKLATNPVQTPSKT